MSWASSRSSCLKCWTSCTVDSTFPPSWSLMSWASSRSSCPRCWTSCAVDSTFPPSWSLMSWASSRSSCPKCWTSCAVDSTLPPSSSLISWACSRTLCSKYFSECFTEDSTFSKYSFTSVSFWYQHCNSCSFLLSSSVRGSFKNVSIAFCHSFAFAGLIWPAILTRASLISPQRTENLSSEISMFSFTWPYIELR